MVFFCSRHSFFLRIKNKTNKKEDQMFRQANQAFAYPSGSFQSRLQLDMCRLCNHHSTRRRREK